MTEPEAKVEAMGWDALISRLRAHRILGYSKEPVGDELMEELFSRLREWDAAWAVRGDTNITDEYKRGFMSALYTVHTAMLAARKRKE